MFLIVHVGDINYGALILGIVSAIIYYKTENLIYSICMHFSGNLLGALMLFYSINCNNDEMAEEVLSQSDLVMNIAVNAIWGVFGVVILVFLLVMAFVRIKLKLPNKSAKLENKTRQKSDRWIKSVILVLVYMVICGLDWLI